MAIKNTHRLLAFIISTCAIVSTAYAESGRTDYDLDDDGLIEINSLADLNEIRNNLDGTNLYGESAGCPTEGCNGFELTTTLDFDTNTDGAMDENDEYWNDGEGWVPIGDYEIPFTATLDGNGYHISNLYIERDKYYVGLFGSISGETAVIKKIGLTGQLMSVTGKDNVGGLAGHANIFSSITSSFSKGRVVGRTSVGGLVGKLEGSSSLTNAFSTGEVSGSFNSMGGVVGALSSGIIMNVFSSVDVEGKGFVGGLFGFSNGTSFIKNVFAVGAVNGSFNVGGLVGALSGTTSVESSFASGLVTADDINYGGLIGYVVSGEVFNSHWITDTTGQEFSDDESEFDNYFGATLTELQCPTSTENTECLVSNTLYANWDSTVWDFGTNQELPGLIIDGIVYRDSNGDGSLDVNQSPEVALLLKQDGDVVSDVIVGAGDVTIEAVITDPDASDDHTLTWTLSDSFLIGETDNTRASFSSDNLPDGEYTVSVVATDNRYSPLSDDASITFTVERNASSAPENSTSSSSSGGGGALGLFWLLMGGLLLLGSRRSRLFAEYSVYN